MPPAVQHGRLGKRIADSVAGVCTVLCAAAAVTPAALAATRPVNPAVTPTMRPPIRAAAPEDAGRWQLSGALQGGLIYNAGTRAPYLIGEEDWLLSSNSGLQLRRGRTQLGASYQRGAYTNRFGDPSRHFTLDFANPTLALRYGDVHPELSVFTTGYVQVSGAQGQLRLGKRLELTVTRGLSRRATPRTGFYPGQYRQRFQAGRLVVRPTAATALGASVVRMDDDPASLGPDAGVFRQRARDNLLLGADATLPVPRAGRSSLTLEYVGSLHTADRLAADHGGLPIADGPRAAWLSRHSVLRGLAATNDSTRAGDLVAARLTVPGRTGQSSLEYRRASRNYRSLMQSYESSDAERIRLSGHWRMFGNAVAWTYLAERARGNLHGADAYTPGTLNLYTSLQVQRGKDRRFGISWRQNDRRNDGPPPAPGRGYDRRMELVNRGLTLSGGQDLRVGGREISASGSISETWLRDRYRPASAYRRYAGVFELHGPRADRIQWSSRFMYSESERAAAGFGGAAFDGHLRQSVGLGRWRLSLTEGLARSDEYQQRSLQTSWSAGVRWEPRPASSVEVEWHASDSRNGASQSWNYARRTLELRLRHAL